MSGKDKAAMIWAVLYVIVWVFAIWVFTTIMVDIHNAAEIINDGKVVCSND